MEIGSDKIDQKDLKILEFLRKNARETLTNISRTTGVPISSIFDRLKRLEQIGIIRRHTTLLDTDKIGFKVRAFLLFKTRDGQKDLEEYLMGNPHMNNMIRVNGNLSLLVEVWFRDIGTLESFVAGIRKAFKKVEISVHYVLKDIERECFMINEVI